MSGQADLVQLTCAGTPAATWRLIGDAADLDRPAAGDTAATALENLSLEAVLELIATLPPHQAEVIVLQVVAGLDVGQVARITGGRPGAVRVAAHRGLRVLAARLSLQPRACNRGHTRRCNAVRAAGGSLWCHVDPFPPQGSPVSGCGDC